jgi:hypothetical protein
MANNPYDFFTSDPITDIPLRDIISFVDAKGKGYIMDRHSAASLMDYAAKNKETPVNPFNREELPLLFLRRMAAGGHVGAQPALEAQTDDQKLSLAVTDLFRAWGDLDYYTDPAWFMSLSETSLQRLYMELGDIWYHRVALTSADRARIVPPPTQPFPIAFTSITNMTRLKALRLLLLKTCGALTTSSPNRGDRQTGLIYVLGAMAIVEPLVGAAYPVLREQFATEPFTQVRHGQIRHPVAQWFLMN